MNKYLIVQASTNSDWDCCEFAIVYIDSAILEHWNKVSAVAQNIPKELGLTYGSGLLSLFENYATFYRDIEEIDDYRTQVEQEVFVVADLDDDFINQLSVPENRIDGDSIRFDFDGNVSFKAYGKHSGEEFWTEGIPLKDIQL